MLKQISSLNKSGIACHTDVVEPSFSSLFEALAIIQEEFLSFSPHPPGYPWPKDALRTWSRSWEYPYVFHHLSSWRTQQSGSKVHHAVDFGSGLTFFPFAVARLGYAVTCIDIDPICQAGLEAVAQRMRSKPGQVTACISNGSPLPFADASVDVVYSISVLEHLDNPAAIIAEFARILAPAGHLILTFDVDLRQGSRIGLDPATYERVYSNLDERFDLAQPPAFAHPALFLRSDAGPFPLPQPPIGLAAVYESIRTRRGMTATLRTMKQQVMLPLLTRRSLSASAIQLACEGSVWRRKATATGASRA